MKIERKYQRPAAIDKLPCVFMQRQLFDERIGKDMMIDIQLHHRLIELGQPAIEQFLIIDERPLPSGKVIAVIVPFPRKVDPFRMTELVADEVEIPFA